MTEYGWVAAAGTVLLVAVASAFVAYKMLKRTVKMAFRVVIVILILGIAAAGSIALWALSGSSSQPARPARQR